VLFGVKLMARHKPGAQGSQQETGSNDGGLRTQRNPNDQRLLLALDTSTRSAGVALYDGAQVLCETTWTSLEAHTTELAPAVADALRKAGISAANLGAVGVALGPGSFTGLRIGLALAKGLVLALHIPLIGIPTLDILAAAQPVFKQSLAVVLRAGRGRLAVGWYQPGAESWQAVQPIEVLTPEQLAERIQSPTQVCGELVEEERLLLSRDNQFVFLGSPAGSLRRAGYLAELAWKRWQTSLAEPSQDNPILGDDPTTLAPIYLHYNEPIPG
jgi:tRNA threonylcarbamoyladenosine biosynthesis protein TsaB